MNTNVRELTSHYATATEDLLRLQTSLEQTIVGQRQVIRELLAAIFAGGHVLLEGLPGLGKTHLAKALAAALGTQLARVQCTPDLMPSEITGSEILHYDEGGARHLAFRRGPIFASMVLVDEINRATPKTQAALLEAMQEHQVTHAGERHRLPSPFWVLATQNPIEIEGTYPLPEAQLDRFMAKIQVEYPDSRALMQMLDVSLDDEPADHLDAALTIDGAQRIMALVRGVVVAQRLKQAAVELVLTTQPLGTAGNTTAARHFRYGASPRGLQALLRLARVLAVMNSRVHLTADDLAEAALPVLRHRVLLTIDSELSGIQVDSVLSEILEQWRQRLQ